MILKINLKVLVITVFFMVFYGCASTNNLGDINTKIGEIKKIESLLFNQLPLPKDARIATENSLILGEGDNWAGRIELYSNMENLEASSYFTSEYPKLGWSLVTSTKSKFTILVFANDTRTVTIEISEVGFSSKSKIIMTVSPKVANEAAARR
jgi:hypothetical protein